MYADDIGIPLSVYGVRSPIRWLSLTAQASLELYVLDFEGNFDPPNGFGFGETALAPDMWHLDLPESIPISTSGFTLTPLLSV